MIRTKNKGFSLVELTVGLVIGAISLMAFMMFWKDMAKGNKQSLGDAVFTQESLPITKYLSDKLPTGNLRFQAYTSTGLPFRFFVPLPGLCADLTSEECTEHSAMLFVRYDKTTAPAISVICQLKDGTQDKYSYFLADLSNATFGEAEPVPDDVNPTALEVTESSEPDIYPRGPVEIVKNSLLAFFVPPDAYLWRVTAPLIKLVKKDKCNGDSAPCVRKLCVNNDCRYALIKGKADEPIPSTCKLQNYNVDKLYVITASPFSLPKYIDGKDPTPATSTELSNVFPARTFNVRIESVGMIKDERPEAKPETFQMVVNRCRFEENNGIEDFICSDKKLWIEGISKLRIDEKFKVAFLDTKKNETAEGDIWYEILYKDEKDETKTMKQTEPQPGDVINPLWINNIEEIPSVITYKQNGHNAEETISSLRDSGMSLIKQQEVNIIRFRYFRDRQPGNIHVFLP